MAAADDYEVGPSQDFINTYGADGNGDASSSGGSSTNFLNSLITTGAGLFTAATTKKNAPKSTTPAWLVPVAIVGGLVVLGLVAVMVIKK
jgi:hypothetical protein